MKHLLLAFLVLFTAISFAQDSTTVKAETPKIITKLQNGATYNHEDISIKFIKVVTDSRCPKNVMCIRAGEAEVLVAVFNKGKKVEEKLLKILPTATLQNTLNLIFKTEAFSISGFNLLPYPENGFNIKAEDYVLQLQVSN
ncbi:MAG: hypothetical protein WBF67_09635 [Olleya sp.]